MNINGGYRPGYRPGYGGGGNWGYRPGYGGGGNWGYRPGWGYHQSWVNGYWHGHWNRSNWNWGSFALGTAVGGLAGWGFGSTLWNWGYTPYVNPYYAVAATPVVVQQPVVVQEQPVAVQQPIVAPYDYSQPINTQGAPPPEDVSNPAVAAFDEARSAFKQGDYARALALTDQSLKTLPNDATAHEFRALCLFALKNYPQAAGPLYAVLSVGPGWDWTTMIGLYPEAETYTQQLRALEDFVRANPSSAPAHFVLAYHYLTQGHNDAAVGQFKEVVKLQPDDKLSAGLVAAFTTQDAAPATAAASPAAPEQPPATPQPEERASKIPAPAADAVIGTWKAGPEPDVTITLTLQAENKFKWDVTQKGKTQSFDGEYTYGGDSLSLVQSAGPAMDGKLTWTDKDHVNFKIAGGPPQDPGLNFAR